MGQNNLVRTQKKGNPESRFEDSFEKALLNSEERFFPRILQAIRAFLMKFSRRRRHRRYSLKSDGVLLTKIEIDNKSIEVILSDISEGGMGLEVPRSATEHLVREQTLFVLMSFDGENWQRSSTEVRHIRKSSATSGYIGVQFKSPSPNLIAAIRKYRKSHWNWL